MEKYTQILQKDKNNLVKEILKKAISYNDYRTLVLAHAENETSTGKDQSNGYVQYTLLNNSRMRRLDKTIKIPESILTKFQNFKGKQTWLVISESWCGDAAQALPILNKLASINPGIDLKIVLRDDNLELMNAFLTHGSMSIPKLIIFDNNQNKVNHTWGPRPREAAMMVKKYKKEFGVLTPEFKKDLQIWYNKDKGLSTIEEISLFID